ncbi:hypothetical protein AB0M39_40925 [Streptomyces sp. NPDC051907]|uniref:hypothetical protein n=1 Tax=Streptomyces sp. NPDC051907 TaxID=3155284 RepID=UPI003447E282
MSSHVLPSTDVPADFTQMMELANMLAEAGEFLPVKLRKKPHNILAVMLHARALDIPIAVAWKELYLAGDGSVGTSAKLARALARRAGHRIKYVEFDRFHAVALIHCKGEPEAHEVRFTMQEAVALGLTTPSERTGFGGEQYAKQPENMMVARVTTRAITRYCPEVLIGMPLSVEDMLDGEDESAFPDSDTIATVLQEHKDTAVRLLRLAELTGGQPNGVVRLTLLREVFMEARDALALDFAADDTGEYSVRNVLTEKMKEADQLAKGQASGTVEHADPAVGPQSIDDLRSLMEPPAEDAPAAEAEPEPEQPKAAAKRAAKKTPAKRAARAKKAAAKAPEKTQADPARAERTCPTV